MKKTLKKACLLLVSTIVITAIPAGVFATPFSSWTTVVNNGDIAPGVGEYFFSYNQPSINDAGLVVFRARAKGEGGQQGNEEKTSKMTSGIFIRDMSVYGPIIDIALKGGEVPYPNNIEQPGPAVFNEFPSFPRIDARYDTFAFRGQSQPSWNVVLGEGEETRSGTAGIYTIVDNTLIPQDPANPLTTAMRNIDPTGGFPQYLVPGRDNIRFEQYPGAPSPTGQYMTFKGNFTTADGTSMTGVYYRDLSGDGTAPAVKIAERGELIPTAALPQVIGDIPLTFDSTAPPSAAYNQKDGVHRIAFTGLNNEEAPTAGGIFLANLEENAALTTVAGFKTTVPANYIPAAGAESRPTLNAFGEGLSYDGRYLGFWAGWGDEMTTKTLTCVSEGKGKGCEDKDVDVIKNQGIFLADTDLDKLFLVAQTGDQDDDFEDFLFWNFSGKPADMDTGHDDGETSEEGHGARWKSSAFVAVDGNDIVFKGQKNNGEIGLYGALNVDVTDLFDYDNLFSFLTIGMDGGLLDPLALGLPITSFGIERDGFRNGQLAITASMTDGETSWAGIYTAQVPVPEPGTLVLFSVGLSGLALWRRKK